jgi:DivIVA domain-containing protein
VALIWVLLGIVVLGGVAVVAAGRGEGLPPAEPDRPDLTLSAHRPVIRADVDAVRFSVGLRGYRMDEVDDVLDRVAAGLEERDARIAVLEQRLAAAGLQVAAARGSHTDQAPEDQPVDVPEHAPVEEPAEHSPGGPDESGSGEPAAPTSQGQEEDDQPRVARTMIVPIEAAEPTQPGGAAGA